MHPRHGIFSTASTIEEFNFTAAEMRQQLLTVRSPSRDERGKVNKAHEVSTLQHFDAVLVSLAAFREANLVERVALRKDPFTMPSERLKVAVVRYLGRYFKELLQQNIEIKGSLGSPRNEQQELARRYRDEQINILQEILQDLGAE